MVGLGMRLVPLSCQDIPLVDQRLIEIAMLWVPDAHELDARGGKLIAGLGDVPV